MKTRTFLLAALAIVCATNIVTLAHAALNRRAAPDAELTLTERELMLWPAGADTTATWLRLRWSQPAEYGRTDWIACDRLEALGFSCDAKAGRQSGREAFVVLEYDGRAWQTLREHLIAQAAQAADAARQAPGTAPQDPARSVEGHSRLVAVDVGPDAEALRATYPDRSRYLITRGRVSVFVDAPRGERATPRLTIAELAPATISVPRAYAALLAPWKTGAWAPYPGTPRYTVALRYGRFHEPWIAGVDVRR